MFRKGPKRASKVQESKLIKNAEKLAEDPLKVIPECRDSCWFCKFGKAEKYIKKISNHKDDKKYLEKLSRKGPMLSRAVAGTLLLTIDKKAPLLASAKTSRGDISYARKGNASEKYLLGVQYFNDPVVRLFAYHHSAKKGFYFYSWKSNIVCTGKKDQPPDEYIQNRLSSIRYRLKTVENNSTCGHTVPSSSASYVTLEWRGIGTRFSICSGCARNDVNLFMHLTEGMLSHDNSESFSLKGRYRLECASDCRDCSLPKTESITGELKEKYFSGELSDVKFLKDYKQSARNKLKKSPNAYVLGTRCFGNDKDLFLKGFDYEDYEEKALKKAIEGKPLVVDQNSVNELLGTVWKQKGKEIIRLFVGDEERIDELYESSEERKITPRDVLRTAYNIKKKNERLKSIPSFEPLPTEARMAHELAMVYKTQGKDETISHIDGLDISDTRLKALTYGFLEALNSGDSHQWRYDRTEIDVGKSLKKYVLKLLESEGDEYARALQDLMRMSGSTAKIVLEDGTELR